MKTDIDLDLRLKRWGLWCNYGLTWGLDFPGRSLLARLDGTFNTQGVTSKTLMPTNQEAEEINALVEQLGSVEPELAKVLYVNYTIRDTLASKAAKVQLEKGAFRYRLEKAVVWMGEKLDIVTVHR